jgi:hypothetical protein
VVSARAINHDGDMHEMLNRESSRELQCSVASNEYERRCEEFEEMIRQQKALVSYYVDS